MGHSPEVADLLLQMGTPFAFVTGYDVPLEPRHADVPLLHKPFTADQLRALLGKLRGPGAGATRWPRLADGTGNA
jgi:hypothetical protein